MKKISRYRGIMGAARKKVAGSTIIETVVSSVIFLIVFMLSLDILTSLVIRRDSEGELISADFALENCVRNLEKYALEGSTEKFPWGVITVVFEDYDEENSLVKATVTSRIGKMGTTLSRKVVYSIRKTE